MKTRAEAVAYLRAYGLAAEARDWALGETIVVGAEPFTSAGITGFTRAMYIVPSAAGWTTVELDHPWPGDEQEVTLAEACARVVDILTAMPSEGVICEP